MLSESQERMLLVAQKGREQEVFRVFEKWGLDAVEVGRVTNDGKMRVLHHGEVVAEIPNQALTDDAPVYKRPLERWEPPVAREMPEHIRLAGPLDLTPNLKRLLSSPNICGKRWIWQQYDSMVQTNTVEGPGAGDAGVIRIKGSQRGLAMALDGNGTLVLPRSATGRHACRGGSRAQRGLRRRHSHRRHQLPELRQSRKSLTSCGSSRRSLTASPKPAKNWRSPSPGATSAFTTKLWARESIPRRCWELSAFSKMCIRRYVRISANRDGLSFCSVLPSRAMPSMLSLSLDLRNMPRKFSARFGVIPPQLDLEKEAALQKVLVEMAQIEILSSAHDCSDGGIAVALAESGFAKGIGMSVDLASQGLPPEFVLFGEDAGRVLVSCDREKVGAIKELALKYGITAEAIGETTPDKMEIALDGRVVVSASISELREAYEGALEQSLRTEPDAVAAD